MGRISWAATCCRFQDANANQQKKEADKVLPLRLLKSLFVALGGKKVFKYLSAFFSANAGGILRAMVAGIGFKKANAAGNCTAFFIDGSEI